MNLTPVIDLIEEHITNNHSAIDIGCGNGQNLYPLRKLGFTELIGIEKNTKIRRYSFKQYLSYKFKQEEILISEINESGLKLNDKNITPENWIRNFPKKFKEFTSTYQLVYHHKHGDVTQTEFLKRNYDLILASNVLHFITPNEFDKVMVKIEKALNKNGILFLSVKRLEKALKYEKHHFIESGRYIKKSSTEFEYDTKKYQGYRQTYFMFDEERIKYLKKKYPKLKRIEPPKSLINSTSDFFILRN